MLSLILRENVQTNYVNYVNRKFFEVVVFLRTVMPFLSAPMFTFFPILFIFSDLKNYLRHCHKQESGTFWNLFVLQCQLTFGRPKINLTFARVCLKIC